ncbi:MAG: hypothetical protein QM758_04875 [Armatimonas sp.]
MYRSAVRLAIVPFLISALLGLSGCPLGKTPAADSSAPATTTEAKSTEVVLPELSGGAATYVAGLSGSTGGTKSASTNGKGFIVFPPVMSAPSDSPDFATGCARWLYLNVGGAPELSQSPLWHVGDTLPVYLERDNLRLTPVEAQKAAALIGATHYAVGEAGKDKLSFQVYDRDGKTVGEPVILSGTPAQIAAGLPKAASELRVWLGLPAKTPTATGETPDDLALLGRVPTQPELNISEADAGALRKLSVRSPLAGMLYTGTLLRAESHPEPYKARVQRLAAQAGNNPLILALLAQASSDPAVGAALEKAEPTAGKSLGYAWAQSFQFASRNNQLSAAEKAVQAAPQSADAWVRLSQVQSYVGDDLRRSRTANQLSPTELQALDSIYGKQMAAAVMAARLNPESGTAYLELSTAAVFAGDSELGAKAIARSMDFALRRRAAPRVFFWALEQSAPKWGGSMDAQRAVADRAATLTVNSLPQSVEVMKTLDAYAYKPQAHKLAAAILQAADDKLKTDPQSIQAMDARKAALTKLNKGAEAIEQAKHCAELRPEDAGEQDDLAQCYRNAKRFEEAAAAELKAIQLAPTNGQYALSLSNTYVLLHRLADALPPARKAVQLLPESIDALNALGTLEGMRGNLKEALPHFQKALTLSPADSLSMSNVGETLCRLGRVSEGRPMLEEAMQRSDSPSLKENARKVLAEFPG